MTDLQTLIRTVDPKDKSACDELNLLFSRFIGVYEQVWDINRKGKSPFQYTSSLDVLKAVQDAELEGWEVTLGQWGGKSSCTLQHEEYKDISAPELPTMQLAWMDAIYQAITWKRENDG